MKTKLRQFTAFLMGTFLPGAGHIYAGNIIGGYVFIAISIVLNIGLWLFAKQAASTAQTLLLAFCFVAVFIYAVMVALFGAKQTTEPRRRWHPSIYLIIALGTIGILWAAEQWIGVDDDLFDLHWVRSDEFEPLFEEGDFIIYRKITIDKDETPKKVAETLKGVVNRGDITVNISMPTGDIMRIVGLPGEKIVIQKGKFFADGMGIEAVWYEYLVSMYEIPAELTDSLMLRNNEYAAISVCQLSESKDIELEPLFAKSVLGKPFLTVWPPERFGFYPVKGVAK